MKGLHAVVTGGGSGIGLATARALQDLGARVSVLGRDEARLQATGLAWQACDVSDEASVQAAFDALGAVDVLVNNAGQALSAPLAQTTLAQWQQMLNVNLTGTFLCSRAVAQGMSERGFGRIINVASTAALKGYAYVAAYCAAKHGVLGLTRAMALEYARQGLTVNAVCPGYTETELVQRAVDHIVAKTGRSAEQARAELAHSNPQRRLIQPEEVARVIAQLAAREAGAITGQALAVCGGEWM